MTSIEEQFGIDLKFTNSLQYTANKNLALIDELDNVKQAIVNRLRTRRGEVFGHPDYGTDLYVLIGKPITTNNVKLAKLYFLEGILADPRVSSVSDVRATFNQRRNMIQLFATGVVISNTVAINLVYPFFVNEA